MPGLGSRDWEVVSVPLDEPDGPDEALMALLGEGEVFKTSSKFISLSSLSSMP